MNLLNVGVTVRLNTVRELLAANPAAGVRFRLPDGRLVPPHYHVTEVGRVRKDFIDCGGTVRADERCVLQLWVAADEGHRLQAAKLTRIISLAARVLGDRGDDLPVEVEYDVGVITQFRVAGAEVTGGDIHVRLEGKHTACLAPDRCGAPVTAGGKCC